MSGFNEIISSDEKRGGKGYFSKTGFVDWISENKLVHMGFIGQKYTLMAIRGFNWDIWERLDRVLCSMEWMVLLGDGYVRHLPGVFSDHCPIMLCLHSFHRPRSYLKPFRFDDMWLKHEGFRSMVQNHWAPSLGSLPGKLQSLFNKIKMWNNDTLGCIF
ncbi:hypothetical protein Ddye_031243 [Dipteronia dyeriana]|uniref:Endonuclease/exonuclease/phosphatase domain-containing protein n=1 Tax=Dipteronia dyeriana TaxID=168575 RepID=A0AAD9WMD6_9ROSI|nr:hypothetical protein Ddye_031243 [Dipteronia dyeriana]